MTIFVEADREARRIRSPDKAVAENESEEDEEEEELEIAYTTSVGNAIQRLHVMGFTLERCKREFESSRTSELGALRDAQDADQGPGDIIDSYYAEEIKKYEQLTFEEYTKAFQRVLEENLHFYKLTDGQKDALSDTERYILDSTHEDWPHSGFLCEDVRSFIRMALSLVPNDKVLRQDITELISSGWVGEDDKVRDEAVQQLTVAYPENAPRIILTEGSSDAEILEKSLALLFPHLVGYYTFFDFRGSKAAGGATQLISVVKAFAASGIANRVIAVLDNDTAAHEARRALADVPLPSSIRLLHYPVRDWLKEYPTLGPSGDLRLDVNNRAGSVELYLGADVLTEHGALCPVQWTGYSQAMRAYQGEVINKAAILEKWRAKANRCSDDPMSLAQTDWTDLLAVWEAIILAFPP